MIKQTSMLAYQEVNSDGTAESQRMFILRAIRKTPDITRNELSETTGIRINAICGRCNELIKLGSVYEKTKRKDEMTGRLAYPIFPSEIKVIQQ